MLNSSTAQRNGKSHDSSRMGTLVLADSSHSATSIKLGDILKRQMWLILACVSLGGALASLYWINAAAQYASQAKVMVSQRSSQITSTESASADDQSIVDEDVLANHMEIIKSRRIVETALKRHGLLDLESITSQLEPDVDAAEYVIKQIQLKRGGEGTAKTARVLSISFSHVNPDDAKLILEAILIEYQTFLGSQLSQAMSEAGRLVEDAQNNLETALEDAQTEYVEARQKAPVLFQGEGSGSVFLEQYKRLHEELLTMDIKQATVKTRLEKAKELVHAEKDGKAIDMDALGVIDPESLQRLSVFAALQADAGQSAEFLADQPARLEEARAQYSKMLTLMAEEQRLKADFGLGHPEVRKLQNEIALVKSFVAEKQETMSLIPADTQLTPGGLMKAYVGFLESDLVYADESRREMETLLADAEKQARTLVGFELQEGIMRSRIDRTQLLFDGVVEQLRDLDLATGMRGYIHEILEAPRRGEKVWPKLSLCGIGGLMMGLIAGLFLGVMNDQQDDRFRTSEEIDSAIGIPILIRVGRMKTDGKTPIVPDNSPEGESFRILRTLLLSDVREGRLRILSASSPLPQDGKSTILANLAAAFAKLDMSVVLIEADMRRPTFHKRFGVPDSMGLSELLRETSTIDDVTVPSGVPNLTLITAGGGVTNPSELLQGESFDRILAALRERFQLVVIDVGPVLAVSDPIIVAQKSDGMLLVVRSANDTRQQVTEAVETLRAANAKMLGCVVNTYGSGEGFERRGYYGGYYSSDRAEKSADDAAARITASRKGIANL
ncbi:MAG: polysaccharide biosynthesis tyrosine autokinase [Planctomycetaceae bacterium]